MSALPFALQLYTIRDMFYDCLPSTLDAVKKAGYDNVELIEPNEMSPRDFKALLDSAELTPVSLHVGLDELEANPLRAVEKAQIYDVKYIIMPWIPTERLETSDGWQKCADSLTSISSTLKENGVQLCFHNHDQEFNTVDGKRILDLIISDDVHLELDVYWATFAGSDPVTVIREFSGRLPLLHTKDMHDAETRKFDSVGSGILDWPSIFDAARQAGVLWYIVEQDDCYGDPIAAITKSADFLKRQL